jgi:hypothetical protein
MNILIARSFDPLAEQLEMKTKDIVVINQKCFVSQAICVDAWRQN